MNERGDAELVRKALDGRQEAFGRLLERYKDAVFGAAFHRLGNFEEARDAAQETFVKAFRNLGKLRRPEAFANWLYRIAAGTALDAARKRRAEVSLEDIGEVAEASGPSEDGRVEQAWEALETLPEGTLREEAARQRGRIEFEFEGSERRLAATFGRRVMRLEVRGLLGG